MIASRSPVEGPDSPSPGSPPAPPAAIAAAVAALLVAVALAYAPALEGDFTFDDLTGTLQRPELGAPGELLAQVPRSVIGQGGRAVADLTFAFDIARAGLAPGPLHQTGLAVHLVAVFVAFLLARTLLARAGVGGAGAALAAAALFGLHPLASEAVAYIVQRQESLAALLAMLAVLLGLRAEARLDRLGVAAWVAGTLSFALSLGAKASGLVAPPLFLLAAVAFPGPGRRARPLRALALCAPWILLGGVHVIGLTGYLGGSASAGFDMYHVRAGPYWLAQGRALLAYLSYALWPSGLSVDHDFPLPDGADSASVLALVAIAAGAATTGAVLLRSTRPTRRLAAFGFAWFLVALLPTSVLPIRDVLVEHRAYPALPGVALALVALALGALDAGAVRLPGPRLRAVAAAAALAVALGLGVATRARAASWGDVVQLWAEACRTDPAKFRPRANYALLLEARGDAAGAVREFEAAVRLDPATAFSVRPLAPRYAWALFALGRAPEAVGVLDRRLARRPDDAEALAARSELAAALGPPEAAVGAYLRAVSAYPRNAVYRRELALALARWGRRADACVSLLDARGAVDADALDAVARSLGCR